MEHNYNDEVLHTEMTPDILIHVNRFPRILSGGSLKLLAIAAMVLDHGYKIALSSNLITFGFPGNLCILIGRIAFPLFCFLLVEGFLHTRDEWAYLRRLGLFALVSEIPFDFAFLGSGGISPMGFLQSTNVFYTLFLGFFVMILIRRCSESPFPTLLILTLGYGVAELLQTDYSGGGVLLIALLYLCREKRVLQFAMIAFISIFLFGGVNALATVAILPIALYNGERGIRFKYVFYWFYPAHLLLFALLAGIMA